MLHPEKKIYLIRHGETAWTLSGQHTGATDIPLTDNGRQQAILLKKHLQGHLFNAVYTSPLKRAIETCEETGLLKHAKQDPDLMEWNYGSYEGLTTEQIWKLQPHWNIFINGAPGGESPADVGSRITRLLAHIQSIPGDIALFSHGHFLRALAAKWLQMPFAAANGFALCPGSLSILGYERRHPALLLWNQISI